MRKINDFIKESMVCEAKKHPLINKEIKTKGEFEPGDIVLFRELYEQGDEHAIMFVSGIRNGYVSVADIGTSLSLGSSRNVSNTDIFKIGHIDCKLDKYGECRIVSGEMVAEIFDVCEKAGLDCTIPKEREMKRAKRW